MQLAPSAWHVFSASLVFFIGFLISFKLPKFFEVSKKKSIIIYFWHTIFCVFYAQYVITNGGDAGAYFNNSLLLNDDVSFGTAGIVYITHLFSSVLGLSFLGVFLVFNIFGYVGLLAFDASLHSATWDKSKNIRRLATLIIFLPSVSFWSSAIGKDALSFMATGLALWAALDLRRRTWLMGGAILVMLLVRPHMAGLMVVSVAGSMIFQKNVSLAQRALVGGMALIGAALLVPFALNYSGLGSGGNAEDLATYIEERQGYNQEGGGGIDIAGMSLPMQLFTYLFRPLPYEAHSIFAFASAIDNVVLLLIFLLSGLEVVKRRKRRKQIFLENRTFLWMYSLSAWVILSSTTANLGISVRQKWMFAPMLIFLLITVLSRPRRRMSNLMSVQAASRENP